MDKKLTKKDLADVLAEKYGYTKKDSLEIITTVFDEIENNLVNGDTTDITGFGKFLVKVRKARTGINPATGDRIEIGETKAVAFKPSKALKEKIK